MMVKRIRMMTGLVLSSASVAFAGSVFASTPEDSDLATMRSRIAQLEAREAEQSQLITQLREKMFGGNDQAEYQNWLSPAQSESVRALVRETMTDAGKRQSLLGDDGNAGWDHGFYLASGDGNFHLRILGQIEFRWIYSRQQGAPGGDNEVSGFENTRTRLGFKGYVLDPSWSYFIWSAWGSTGSSLLLDVYVTKKLDDHWAVQVGQFKLPNWREWEISETRQQFSERSLLDARYRSLYSQGVQVHYTTDHVKLHGAFSDGLQSFNNPWNVSSANSPYLQAQTDFALTGRAEFLLEGEWKQFADFEGWRGEDPGTMIGVSGHWQKGESGDATVSNEIIQWSVDAAHEGNGFNLFGAVIGTHVENDSGINRNEIGFLVQSGVFLNDDWELLARYEWGDLDGAGGVAGDDLSILTVGVSRFWNRHALKFTTDVGYAFDQVDAAWGGAGRGWRGDGAGEDGQIVIRSQINLLF